MATRATSVASSARLNVDAQHGPERDRFSDPDASRGHRSAIGTRKGGGFYGYKIQAAVCTATGLPLAWRVESARHHESKFVAPLLDAIRARGFHPTTVAMDKGYDNTRVYAECEERGCEPIIPLRGAKANQPALIAADSFRARGIVVPRFAKPS